jgi:polysaccharide pyruvyl transferase WcaK-like protein
VYPDLVFGLKVPCADASDPRTVGVGVMAYYGDNDDRREADELHDRYVTTLKSFVRWLVDGGYRVRLFWGDSNGHIDGIVVDDILADIATHRPDLDPGAVIAEPCSSPGELMDALARVGTFVGTRYHNVVSALRLSKPSISIGYSAKFDALMADMGLAEFCQPARSVDFDKLTEQFDELQRRAPELRQSLMARNRANTVALNHQFAKLSMLLFSAPDHSRPVADAVVG